MKILVRNLPRTMAEHELRPIFSAYGFVTTCNLILDQESGKSKGFAFVEMPNYKEAEHAISDLNLREVGQKLIRVKKAKPSIHG